MSSRKILCIVSGVVALSLGGCTQSDVVLVEQAEVERVDSAGPLPAEPPPADPEARAIEVLRHADEAIREVRWLSYSIEWSATHAGRSRVQALVEIDLVERDMQKSRFNMEALVEVPNPWQLGYARESVLVQDGSVVWLLDMEGGVAEKASTPETLFAWNPAANLLPSLVAPQYFREDPLGVEIDQAIRHEYVGTGRVGDVDCDVVFLEFPEDSGMGEQYLYFGRQDHLLRRIFFANVVDSAGGPPMTFEFIFTDLEWGAGEPPFDFTPEIPESFTVVDRDAENRSIGTPVPDLELTTLDGERIRLRDLRGQAVVLEFWASWCPICRRTLPVLDELREELEGHPVRILAVNMWDKEDPAPYMKELGLDLQVVVGGTEIADALKVFATSQTLVIDPQGRIRLHEWVAGPVKERKEVLRQAVLDSLDTGP